MITTQTIFAQHNHALIHLFLMMGLVIAVHITPVKVISTFAKQMALAILVLVHAQKTLIVTLIHVHLTLPMTQTVMVPALPKILVLMTQTMILTVI
jgi:hypothetical protein